MYFGTAYGMNKKEIRSSSEQLMQQFNYGAHYKNRIEHLSGGTQQKLNLCLSMLHYPELLILDEPYVGFDWETYLSFWTCARSIISKGGSILIVSHLIMDKTPFDRIYKLVNGKLECA